MSPLRARTGLPSGNKFRIAASRFETGKFGRVASLSAAAAMVLGVGTASALFVDYLADRALDRKTAAIEVTPLVTAAVDSVAEVASPIGEAHAAPMVAEPALPAAVEASPAAVEPEPMKPMPIEAVLPDAEAIAKVAVGPEHAIELPDADPTDEPIVSAYADPDTDDTTAAIAPDEAEPVAKPRKAKAAKAEPAANTEDETEIASLPGVDVGGMAGYPSEGDDQADSKVRTTTRQQAKASAGGVASGTAKVRQAVNMRSGPKKGAGVLGVVPAGSSVSVMSCDGWCQISYNGRTGWVYKSFLSAGAPKKQAAAEVAPKKAVSPGTKSRS